ncbi:ABC transporter permease [Maribacter cobaltidurans]|uniref:Uncharacterized protein n=1 Tax=Maribacter cobaltidurans TaxID=1178778 RepID=A0A223V574_9FLAO|nr:ABC transporter permease [Maribacter cobaltidurans]ASV30551.1 hypothetical protein CJ263_10200 [Maribacter cobaltidurans]GGD79665.1 ABC transporter permease [Maribacter cobaltidurans]
MAFRRLFRKGEQTTTRIISLIAGLAFGMLLLSEVLYYYSYDGFYPDAERLYVVHENFNMDTSSEELDTSSRVSGAIAPALREEVPGVEMATRFNPMGKSVFYTEDKKNYEADFSLADEYAFDVLPRTMISGNAKEVLSSPMSCMVSDKLASQMGGNVMGKVIELKKYPGKKLTINGVFKAIPENTNYNYDVLVSMVSTKEFMWDGTQNWMGNDRYYAVVKLEEGVSPTDLAPAIRKMQEKNQDIAKLEEEQPGIIFKYSLKPIQSLYVDDVKNMILILTTIALTVLIVSLFNYLLLTMSVLVNRAKSSAIHKTCGAGSLNLQRLIFSETALLFLMSILGAFLTLWLIKPFAEVQLGHKLSSVLNPQVVWPLLFFMALLIGAASYFPGRFYSRIPVATAFRNYQQKKGKWKLALLAFQFVGATFILTMLTIVVMQYNSVIGADHGYGTKGIYFGSTSGMEGSKVNTLIHELEGIPGVDMVGIGEKIPLGGAPGNNVKSADGKELFNVADFYTIDENYMSILGIPITEGENFSAENSAVNDMLISKKGADKLVLNGWKEIVGQPVDITQHGPATVRGIFDDFVINTLTQPDDRPAIFHYAPQAKFVADKEEDASFAFHLLIKTKEGVGADMLQKITDVFNEYLPYRDAVVKNLDAELVYAYQSEKGFRNAILAGSAIILLITIIGLFGYTANESVRRKKELAIRRINGATLGDILKSFLADLEFMAIPAVLLGLAGAWFTANKWMENFAFKTELHWGIFLASSFFVLLLIGLIATINYVKAANQNPVESLRAE